MASCHLPTVEGGYYMTAIRLTARSTQAEGDWWPSEPVLSLQDYELHCGDLAEGAEVCNERHVIHRADLHR